MLKENRGVIFAIGLVSGVAISMFFLVWSFPGFRSPTYQQEQFQNAQNLETGKPNPVIRPSIWETYTKAEDSYAQWLMAILSVLATGTSIWAVYLLKESLRETRNAVKSADDAVAVTREMGEAQVRPYLSFANATYEITPKFFVIKLQVKNVGQTPAFDLLGKAKLWFTIYQNVEGVTKSEEIVWPIEEAYSESIVNGESDTVSFIWFNGNVSRFDFIFENNHFMANIDFGWENVFESTSSIRVFLDPDSGIYDLAGNEVTQNGSFVIMNGKQTQIKQNNQKDN